MEKWTGCSNSEQRRTDWGGCSQQRVAACEHSVDCGSELWWRGRVRGCVRRNVLDDPSSSRCLWKAPWGRGCELNRRRNEGRGSEESVSDGQRTDTRTQSHRGLVVRCKYKRLCLTQAAAVCGFGFFFYIAYILSPQRIVNILYLTLDFVIIKHEIWAVKKKHLVGTQNGFIGNV